MLDLPLRHEHVAGVPLGECRRCNDDGPGGLCTCCGQLHAPRTITKWQECVQCGAPTEDPDGLYCPRHPSEVFTGMES